MDYTAFSLADVKGALAQMAIDAESTFGGLNARQLNWRADPGQWSAAQCFEHLLTANRQMFQAADGALNGGPRSIWQRLPVFPGMFGKALIRSQSPSGTKKYVAPPTAQPSTSDIAPDVIQRFIAQQHEAIARLERVDDTRAARAIMTSPFIKFITYSVLDGWRIVAAHERRHFEQARRVTQSIGFPAS